MINNKQIKEAKPGKLKTDTPGLYVNVFSSTANGKPGPLQRKWRYKYRIKTSLNQYTYRHRVIGDWVETNNDPSKNQFTIAGVVARAEEIREAGKQGIDLLAREPVATIPKPLKDKMKEFFEDILFTQNGYPDVKLKFMKDKNRLTYFPEREVTKKGDNRKRKGKLVQGKKVNEAEPRYKDWKMSQDNPDKYPPIDRDTYWGYLSDYNNWLVSSRVVHKPTASSTGIKLINQNYNDIPVQSWKRLHQEILGTDKHNPRKHRANDTLAMLRVFYNWLIVKEDKYIIDNPITKALSLPTIGPRAQRVGGVGTWAKITEKDIKKNKEGLSTKQFNTLTDLLETELILDPQGPSDRQYNRSLLFMRLRLLTGCRPDVSEDLTWDMLNTRRDKIEVISKGKPYMLNIAYAKKHVFDRMKQLKSNEPGHPYVFSSFDKRGNPIGNKKVDKLWKKLRDLAGIPSNWDFYNLKHTSANFIMEVTADINYLADTLGITKEVALKSYVIGKNQKENDKLMDAFWDKKLPKPKLVVSNK
tara:strand:- start:291 stop:1874 length:1584 start_codon:yes stop_codon:yes gene_type:complete